MGAQTLLQRLNRRQILVHFVATCFVVISFQQFSYLLNIGLVQALNNIGQEKTLEVIALSQLSVIGLTGFVIWIALSGILGMLIAFILSLIISARRKWFRGNSLVVLLLAFLFFRADPLGSVVLKIMVNSSIQLNLSLGYFLIAGSMFFFIGSLLLFYLSKVKLFIEKKKIPVIPAAR